MARKKTTKPTPEDRLKFEYNEHMRLLEFCPEPSYFFNVGDTVHLGNLKNVVVTDIFADGKFYGLKFDRIDNNYGNPITITGLTRYAFWHEIRPIVSTTESLVKNDDVDIYFINAHIGGLLSLRYNFGIDMNPDYQRDLVWTEEDKVALIDSIFNNIDIGKFCLVHNDYTQEYLYEIIDGKQRLNAICEFYENRFPYKGKYYNDLSNMDKHWFENFTISQANVDSSNRKQILRYFLLLNDTGRKVDREHIEKIRKMYEEM